MNLIITLCNKKYIEVLNSVIKSIQHYATKHKADLYVAYGGNQQIDKYPPIAKLAGMYDKVLFLDCDIYIHPKSPNIFNIPVNDIASPPYLWMEDPFLVTSVETMRPYYEIDVDYYTFAGVIYGRGQCMQLLAEQTIKLWNKQRKELSNKITGDNSWVLNCDQTYLSQALKQLYPNYKRLDEKWVMSTDKTLEGEKYYFTHAFGDLEKKVNDLQTIQGLI